VGRVGALAVALGIGGAILGFSPVAAADTGDAAGAGQDTGRSADSADSAQRRGRAAASPGAAEAPTSNSRSGRATRAGRGAGAVESDPVVEPAQTRKAETPAPAATVTQAPAAAVDPAPALAPEPEPATIEDLAPVAVRPVVGDTGPDVSADSAVSGDAVVAPVEIAAVAEEAPVMTAAAPDVVSEGEIDPTALLGEDGTGEPGAEPLAWAALAVTRREDLAGPTPELAPAAGVGTAAAGTAAAGDPVVGAREIKITSVDPGEGQEGDTITIKGTGFYPAGVQIAPVSKVYFGCSGGTSQACDSNVFAAVSLKAADIATTSISVVVPKGAKTGFIQLFADTKNGVSWSSPSPDSFTVNPPGPAPTIQKFSPPTGEAGDPVTITGANFSQAAIVNFGCGTGSCGSKAKQATDVTVADDGTSITAVVPNGAVSGNIQVTQGSGTIYTVGQFIVAKPAPATISPNSGDIGLPVEITGTNFMNACRLRP
jgi:hypothetical protein